MSEQSEQPALDDVVDDMLERDVKTQREGLIDDIKRLADDPNSCVQMSRRIMETNDEEQKAMWRWLMACIRVFQDPRPEAEKLGCVPRTLHTDMGSWR